MNRIRVIHHSPLITVNEILERVFSLLERGVADGADAFHNAAFVTVGLDGEPQARTVVFRRLIREPLALICHVDARSPKIAEIERDGRVSWLFYSVPEKLQLRIRADADLHRTDALADEQWRNTAIFSRRGYCGAAPSTPVDAASSGLPKNMEHRRPTEEESERLGRQNFCVARSVVKELDVYELNASGHRRSLYLFDANGAIETRWLTP